MNFVDRTGRRYGRLSVNENTGARSNGHVVWRCRCDCGNIIDIPGNQLTSGRTKSCGCLNSEKAAARQRERLTTHGKSRTPEYFAWQDMRYRCEVPSNSEYKWYGARGINVCGRWRDSFEAFLEDLGPKPTPRHKLTRLDKSKDFEPANVCWLGTAS